MVESGEREAGRQEGREAGREGRKVGGREGDVWAGYVCVASVGLTNYSNLTFWASARFLGFQRVRVWGSYGREGLGESRRAASLEGGLHLLVRLALLQIQRHQLVESLLAQPPSSLGFGVWGLWFRV